MAALLVNDNYDPDEKDKNDSSKNTDHDVRYNIAYILRINFDFLFPFIYGESLVNALFFEVLADSLEVVLAEFIAEYIVCNVVVFAKEIICDILGSNRGILSLSADDIVSVVFDIFAGIFKEI